MLKMPRNVAGPDSLQLLLDDVPRTRWREILGVSQRTINRWLAGHCRVPHTALGALYWHTRWGDSQIESVYGFENYHLRLMVSNLQAQQASP